MITPILKTERLFLRPLKLTDAKEVFNNWTTDEDVAKYMPWEPHKSVKETEEWLMSEVNNVNNINNFTWGIVLKATNDLIGSISLLYREKIECYALGYNIMKKYWGQGITTEAGREVINFGINTLKQKKFYCRHANENIGSMKVMTKLGFKYHAESEYDSFSGNKHFEAKEYYLEI